MPIMAAQGRSDARGTAQLLAGMALRCIANPDAAADQEVALNNVYRLLESYKLNPFFGRDPMEELEQVASQRLSLRRPIERNVEEVRTALEHARMTVFGNLTKDAAVGAVESVLRAVVGSNIESISTTDKENAVRFFTAMLDILEVDKQE